MDGAALAARIRDEVKSELVEVGSVRLATVLVGDDPASQIHIKMIFFFQAEDGIRDTSVTGVQTCALPICGSKAPTSRMTGICANEGSDFTYWQTSYPLRTGMNTSARTRSGRISEILRTAASRSEERRVGKECRSRWAADH